MAIHPGGGVARLLAPRFQHPQPGVRFGADEVGADELGDIAEAMGAGLPFPLARRVAAMRRARGGGGPRCLPGLRRPMVDGGGGGEEVGADWLGALDDIEVGGDMLDGADEAELGAIDDEIGALEGDDEDVGADADREELGASIRKTTQKIEDLEKLRTRLEAKLAATPARRKAKRKHLAHRIEKISKAIARKKAKKEKKVERIAAKLGVPVAALAAGGAAAAAAGITAGAVGRAEADMSRSEALAEMGQRGIYGVTKQPGTELHLPFLSGSSPSVLVQKPIGGAGSVQVTLSTQSISYADFEVLGIMIQATVQPGAATDVLPTVWIDSWGVSGDLSQVYGSTPITHGGNGTVSTVGGGPVQISGRFGAMRVGTVLKRTNTASVTLSFNQAIANGAAINTLVTATLIVRRITDDSVQRIAA